MSEKVHGDSYYRCFICWDDIDFEDTSTKIVSACNCISSDFKYTHKECLNLWINQNQIRRSNLKCQVCGTPFHVKKVFKPIKKIYKENWKKINYLLFTVFFINLLLGMLIAQWNQELEHITNDLHQLEQLDDISIDNEYDYNYESLIDISEWYPNYDERESYIEEYIKEINLGHIFNNVYLNAVTLLLFINTSIFIIFFIHEREKFFEYSIDEKYEYKRKEKTSSKTKFFKIINHSDTYYNIDGKEEESNNKINNDNINDNDNKIDDNNIYNEQIPFLTNKNENEYQKIRII